jgi:hypothetical protein
MKKLKNKTEHHIMKPMSKKMRSRSLLLMLLVFLILSPIILGYSFGYRFSQLEERFSWVKTGGIYVHSNISNTEVFVNGKFFKNSGLILRNIFIQNLKADEIHDVEMHKIGHHSWFKSLIVREGLVTEARALMLPIQIEKIAIAPFFDEQGLATTTLATSSNSFSKNQRYLDLEILFNLATTTDSNIKLATTTLATTTVDANKKDTPEFFLNLGIEDPENLKNLIVNNYEISWIEKGNIVMYWSGASFNNAPHYFCDFSDCLEKIELNWFSEITRFAFMPNRNDVWVVLNNEGIWAVEIDDRSERNIQPIYVGENLDFRINTNNRIVVLDAGVFYELRF